MKKKIIYIATLLVALVGSSCEKYDNLIPGEYDKILSLKEVGEQELTLYKTGEDGKYTLTVMKGGNNPAATSEVNVTIMDEVELAAHSGIVGKSYTLLPESAYEVLTPSLVFGSSDSYQIGEISLRTGSIDELLSSSTDNYVLPVLITSKNDSINAKKNLVILQPNVIIPLVSFTKKEETVTISGDGAEYELTLSLPFESLWDFDCQVTIDESALPSGYELITSDDYTIENEGKIQFTKGNQKSAPIKVFIKNKDAFGSSYVLPIRITDVSMDGFRMQESSFFLYAAYNKVPLTVSMLSTNAQEASEGPIANLIDNNPATYFHSSWSVVGTEAHYFQINLEKEITMCRFDYQNRSNANGKPEIVDIMVSQNGTDWVKLVTIDSGLPVGAGAIYSSEAYTADKAFKYFRFLVQKTNGGSAPTFFNMAEFSLYGK